MARPFTKSTVSYNPKKDSSRTIQQKIDIVFTDHQKTLVTRPDVTKSLILALTKIVDYKQSVEDVVAKWVKQDVSKFMRTLPLLIEH